MQGHFAVLPFNARSIIQYIYIKKEADSMQSSTEQTFIQCCIELPYIQLLLVAIFSNLGVLHVWHNNQHLVCSRY